MKRMMAILTILVLAASPVFAAPKDKGPSQKADAGDRIANEAADAVADVLTGKDTKKTKTGQMPPGLAKKGKTPPGWEKGKKTGWEKEVPAEDSPIKKFFKNLFKSQ